MNDSTLSTHLITTTSQISTVMCYKCFPWTFQ